MIGRSMNLDFNKKRAKVRLFAQSFVELVNQFFIHRHIHTKDRYPAYNLAARWNGCNYRLGEYVARDKAYEILANMRPIYTCCELNV